MYDGEGVESKCGPTETEDQSDYICYEMRFQFMYIHGSQHDCDLFFQCQGKLMIIANVKIAEMYLSYLLSAPLYQYLSLHYHVYDRTTMFLRDVVMFLVPHHDRSSI